MFFLLVEFVEVIGGVQVVGGAALTGKSAVRREVKRVRERVYRVVLLMANYIFADDKPA